MALYVEQDDTRTKLQEKIAADLREKALRNSLDGDGGDGEGPKSKGFSPEDSAYLENTKTTTGLAFVWLLLGIAVVVFAGILIWLASNRIY
ncbi:MAG: hypothetical protein Q4A27_03025 [bacterium]|nr:hypothetical protein [bacterium]